MREFPSGSRRWLISENGGCQPRWSREGDELFYIEGTTLIAVEVASGPNFRIGPAERLFSDSKLTHDYGWSYDVSGDGRFVMIEDVEDESGEPRKPAIRIVENWYEEFRDREQ